MSRQRQAVLSDNNVQKESDLGGSLSHRRHLNAAVAATSINPVLGATINICTNWPGGYTLACPAGYLITGLPSYNGKVRRSGRTSHNYVFL